MILIIKCGIGIFREFLVRKVGYFTVRLYRDQIGSQERRGVGGGGLLIYEYKEGEIQDLDDRGIYDIIGRRLMGGEAWRFYIGCLGRFGSRRVVSSFSDFGGISVLGRGTVRVKVLGYVLVFEDSGNRFVCVAVQWGQVEQGFSFVIVKICIFIMRLDSYLNLYVLEFLIFKQKILSTRFFQFCWNFLMFFRLIEIGIYLNIRVDYFNSFYYWNYYSGL